RRRTGGGWSVFGHPWAWGLLAAETAAVIHAAPRILTVLVERMTQVSSGAPRRRPLVSVQQKAATPDAAAIADGRIEVQPGP
ncbi:MAG: hypothetical protein ACXV3C_03340, partial [Actinomycetes bacterium]